MPFPPENYSIPDFPSNHYTRIHHSFSPLTPNNTHSPREDNELSLRGEYFTLTEKIVSPREEKIQQLQQTADIDSNTTKNS